MTHLGRAQTWLCRALACLAVGVVSFSLNACSRGTSGADAEALSIGPAAVADAKACESPDDAAGQQECEERAFVRVIQGNPAFDKVAKLEVPVALAYARGVCSAVGEQVDAAENPREFVETTARSWNQSEDLVRQVVAASAVLCPAASLLPVDGDA